MWHVQRGSAQSGELLRPPPQSSSLSISCLPLFGRVGDSRLSTPHPGGGRLSSSTHLPYFLGLLQAQGMNETKPRRSLQKPVLKSGKGGGGADDNDKKNKDNGHRELNTGQAPAKSQVLTHLYCSNSETGGVSPFYKGCH